MVSQVLANAILNQRTPDIVGKFREGLEFGRGERVRELSGQALQSGGGEALEELIGLNADVGLAIGETIRAKSAKDINDFIRDAKITERMIASGDEQGALQFAQQRRNAIALRGGDTSQTDKLLGLLGSGRGEEARQGLVAFISSLDQTKVQPASVIERDRLLSDLSSEDPQVKRSAEIALKLQAPARSGLTPEEKAEQARLIAQARADVELGSAGEIERLKAEQRGAGKGISERQQSFINAGIDAADSTANIRRSLDLLKTIKTGGIAAASLRIKQAFGVEGADEGELTANLGIAVLAQLKPIFGAAFTAAEGERLEKISAGFGRNPETNKRLLNQALKIAERSARRAIKAAEAAGDDFTAQEIRDALEFTVTPDDAQEDAVQAPTRRIRVDF